MAEMSTVAPNAAPVSLESLADMMQAGQSVMNNFIVEIRGTLSEIKSDISTIQTRVEENSANLMRQDNRISSTESEITALKSRISTLESESKINTKQRKLLTIEANNKEQRLRAHTLKFVGHSPVDSEGKQITDNVKLRSYFTEYLQTGFTAAITEKLLPTDSVFSSNFCIDESHPLNSKPKPSYAEITTNNNVNLDDTVPVAESVVKQNTYTYVINFTNRHIADTIYRCRKQIIAAFPASQSKLQIKRDLTKVNREAMTRLHENALVACYERSDVKKVKLQSSKVWFCLASDPKVWLPANDPFARNIEDMSSAIPMPST